MEYARKMVLVLQDVYDAMQSVKTTKNEVKDNKMHTILDDPKLPIDHKMISFTIMNYKRLLTRKLMSKKRLKIK